MTLIVQYFCDCYGMAGLAETFSTPHGNMKSSIVTLILKKTTFFSHQPGWGGLEQMVMIPIGVRGLEIGYGPQSTYFPRDETGLVCLPTQLERNLQLYC